MSNPTIHVAVTGGAGQIAYSLLFRIASGEMFGPQQPVALHILELPDALSALEGVKMELQDCAFPLLREIHIGCDPHKLFEGIHYALLIGAKPRGPGMERADLLKENGKIFVSQGRALNDAADRNVKVLVVGNPCNTNCLIAIKNAPKLSFHNFFAMTRLDQNRAVAQLALKANVPVTSVHNVIIWGNHSSTQVPDAFHASINGVSAYNKIDDRAWLENDFIATVQKRGAAIITARGKSSAASAANAIIDTIHGIMRPTPPNHYFSLALQSANNLYGIDNDLVFSFPCRSDGKGNIEIVKGLDLNKYLKDKITLSEQELKEERSLAGVK